MRNRRLSLALFGLIFAFSISVFSVGALASTPEFAITATNVTVPANGSRGFSQYTVTAIPMNGTLAVSCEYVGMGPGLDAPICNYGPVAAPMQVDAGQAVTGMIGFLPAGSAVPVRLRRNGHAAGGLALAGVLLLGFGLRRRVRRWLTLVLIIAGSLSVVAGISSCSASGSIYGTPGTYQYTIAADNESGGVAPLGQGTTTTIYVTVP
jgi:membrane-associated phospholipid phosphatase